MSAPDAAEIAAGLTKAQREAFACSTPIGCEPKRVETMRAFSRMRLAHRLTPWQASMNWTPLGLAVRAILQQDEPK